MKIKLLAQLLLVGGMAFAADLSVGVRIGPPPPPRVLVQPVAPGPGYVWVDGYWYPVGHRYHWHAGYWTLPPYAGAAWIGPRHEGGLYYHGYWGGSRGRLEHNHHWDREHERDHDRR